MDTGTASFGEWLADELYQRDWSQSDLMRAAGLKPGVVSHWINDKRTPGTVSCYKIASALRVDPLEVLTRAGHLDPNDTDVERMRKAREMAEVYERANQANEAVRRVALDGGLTLAGDANHRVIPAAAMPPPDADFDAWLHFFGELDPAIRERLIAVVEQNRAEQEGRADNGRTR